MLVLGLLIAMTSGKNASENEATVEAEPIVTDELENNNKKEVYNILLLGVDESQRLTDVLMIVSCDTKTKEITALQIPRDTYAEYTSSSYRKINAACDVLNGGEGLSAFITENLGIAIDGYVSVDVEAIGEAVDILGGVEIDVPMDMTYKDPYQNLTIKIEKGEQTLDGEKAKQFVRYREGYVRGDLGRLDAQKLFVSAFLKSLAGKKDIVTAIQLVSTVLPKTDSNLSLKECIDIVGKMGIPNMNSVKFMTLPGGDVRTESGAWYYVMNRSAAYKIIKGYFNPELLEPDFDKKRRFTSSARKGFGVIYDAQSGFEIKIYSADEIDSEMKIESKYD